MKSIKILVLFLAALFLSCNNGDDQNTNQTAFEGAWLVKNVRGGIAGTNHNYNGEITWTFADGTVSVVNNNTDQTKVDLIETGSYPYVFVPNPTTPSNCAEALYIDGVSYGCREISGQTMTLSQIESDGYEVTLEKIGMQANQ